MTRIRILLILILSMVAFCESKAQSFRIMSYNVENLFDTINDPLTSDEDFTPESQRHWDSYRYWHKLQKIAEVVANVGEWQHAALIGLIEIENDSCLYDLCHRSRLRKYGYRYVHYDSPDVRGIDVALLYDSKQFQLIEEHAIRIDFGYDTRPTRDLLYAKGVKSDKDTLHIIVCHTPSQLGGQEAKQKRNIVLNTINNTADSILKNNPSAQIVLTGDFNDSPQNISPHIPALTNLMNADVDSLLYFPDSHVNGTYYYQEQWSLLDQIFVSPILQKKSKAHIFNPPWILKDGKPHRTYKYIIYDRNGFSDHLPVFLDLF